MNTPLRLALALSAAIHLGVAALVSLREPEPPLAVPPLQASLPAAPAGKTTPAASATAARKERAPARPAPERPLPQIATTAPSTSTVAVAAVANPSPQPAAVAAGPAPAAGDGEPKAAPLEPPRYNAAYLNNPRPAYPRQARQRGLQGTVLVEARVGIDGDAREVKLAVSSGDESLDRAALEAVRHWRFVPARRGDQRVEDSVRIPLVFRLD